MAKTFIEQLEAVRATIEAKHAERVALMEKSGAEDRTLDMGESEEFKSLSDEIKQLQTEEKRLNELIAFDKTTAKPVEADVVTGAPVKASVNVRKSENLKPGIGFARLARVRALSSIEKVNPLQLASALYPNDSDLHDVIHKAAVGAASTASETWAGNLVLDSGAYFADFVEYLRPRTVIGQVENLLRRLPFDTPVLVGASGGTAGWVGEGQAKPLTKWGYTQARMVPYKVAAIAAATKETLKRSSEAADVLIRDELTNSIVATIDTTFVSADAASAGVSPAGLRNDITGLAGMSAGADPEDVLADIKVFLQTIAGNVGGIAGCFWVVPEQVAISLSLMTTLTGAPAFPGVTPTGGTLAGIPLFVSAYMPVTSAGSIVMLVKGDEIFYGDDGGIDVSVSDNASLVMDSEPNSSSVTPTAAEVVSMFQTNSVAFLVERILNWQRRRAGAVVWATTSW